MLTTYKNIIAKSDTELIERVRVLAEKDPAAVVILLGDHGVRLNALSWLGERKDLNDNMLESGLQPADVSRDMFEVFMAIKWPKGTKRPHEYFSHVNLFRQVFAVLAKEHSILRTQVSNDSFILDNRNTSHFGKISLLRTVKDGKPLDRWEPFAIPIAR